MNSFQISDIIYCDTEVDKKTDKINEIGLVYKSMELQTHSLQEASTFVSISSSSFIAGHNFIDFDIEKIKLTSLYNEVKKYTIIDTLPLSLLLFSEKTLHSLSKDYKSEDNFENNPLKDSLLTKELFEKIEDRFNTLEEYTKTIFYTLLKDNKYFTGFFKYIEYEFLSLNNIDLKNLIVSNYGSKIINLDYLSEVIENSPIELAYIIAIWSSHTELKSHPPKVLYDYPNIVEIQKKLCFNIDIISKNLSSFAKETFGFGDFREFEKLNPTVLDTPTLSQREVVEASLKDESFLCILPTGGGKTFTFWLPAIIKASSYKGLTVVISPLQALIEDHIKNFNANVANHKAVAISGFMNPSQRAEAVEQVVNAEADILYIAPESLRSNMIFNILKNRFIERFVIDEAHCLSTWGNDFRQDYYYICDYIKELCEKKSFQKHIPISCFTATAKPSVIEDIEKYFLDGLNIKLDKYLATPERKNLNYHSIESNKKGKYNKLLKILNDNEGSSLIYIPSSTKECDKVAEQLALDTGRSVKSFHSKIESQEKMDILKRYIENDIEIIVATTAFGMGVDKPNIKNVIHYEVSDSLESYAQEAGRGARDQSLEAYCPILFDEDDLDKHFATLNRSKLTASEVNSIFRVIKSYKGNKLYKTAFELAKDAGWDVEDSSLDYTTKVKTALLELQREGYISRKRNKVNFFADSIDSDAINKLNIELEKSKYEDNEKDIFKRILQAIIGRGKIEAIQVDELSHILGYNHSEISLCINQLKEMNILGNEKDLSLEAAKGVMGRFQWFQNIENMIFNYMLELKDNKISIRVINEYLHHNGAIKKNETELIKQLIKSWQYKSDFSFKRVNKEKDIWFFEFKDKENIKITISKKHYIANKLLEYFKHRLPSNKKSKIEFSLNSLKIYLDSKYMLKEIDKVLLYLHNLKRIALLNGRFISYSPMSIQKNDKLASTSNYAEYTTRLEPYYKTKIESIHIMGEYASMLKSSHENAMKFLKDYFILDYKEFIKKYELIKEKITRPITQKKFDKIYKEMSSEQKRIIEDKTTKAMMILAGPGSGKTKVLVHKIASLILTENIKPEQFMMLTFSKSAKWEFKNRLNSLIGSLSYDVEIQTFHAYSLKLIARDSKNDNMLSKSIIEATKQILDGDIKLPHIAVLVLDEYQDINEDSFKFVKAIYASNSSDMRIIAVGDDDQCIMDFVGANVKFIDRFEDEFSKDEDEKSFKKYELLCNFRSDKNIVKYSNEFRQHIKNKYKENELYSNSKQDGVVSIYSYENSQNLVEPVVEFIKDSEENNNVAILAYKNDEIMQIYSLLKEHKIDAKFILDRENFELKNIVELYEFNKLINSYLLEDKSRYKEEHFEKALYVIENRYKGSSNLKLLDKVVDKFLIESDEYYVSKWISYLDEIKLENFEEFEKGITLSTIHKSKGMEFDKVFLLKSAMEKKNKEEKIRLFYVGMTRAKSELNIFRLGKSTQSEKDYVRYCSDNDTYVNSAKLFTHIMSLSDISLGYNYEKFEKNNNIIAGIKVYFDSIKNFKNLCIVYRGKPIAVVSKSFQKILDEKLRDGFRFYNVLIEHVVIWHDEENKKELKHPLCRVVMRKN